MRNYNKTGCWSNSYTTHRQKGPRTVQQVCGHLRGIALPIKELDIKVDQGLSTLKAG